MVTNFFDEVQHHTNDLIIESGNYRNMIDCLQFLARSSRPDIMLSVTILAQYLAKPTQYLSNFIKRIFGYLKLTKHYALQFDLQNQSDEILLFHCDSDFGGDRGNWKSSSGWIGSTFGYLFTWCSRKQLCTALSTPKEEYIAMCETCSNANWTRTFLAELGFILNKPSKLFCNNTVAITWAENTNSMTRAKHIDLKYHFVKDCTTNSIIDPQDIDSEDNPADGFTNPLI